MIGSLLWFPSIYAYKSSLHVGNQKEEIIIFIIITSIILLYKKTFTVTVPAHLCEGVCECGGNQAQDNEDLHGLVWFEGGKLKKISEWLGSVAGNWKYFRMVGFGGGKLQLFQDNGKD
jgi:hypothetical protein